MKGLLAFAFCALAVSLFAQQPVVEEPRVRFRAVDIFVNATNAPLAAYQLEFAVTNNAARIVGIEGGEASAFRDPPFHDPKAIQRERVIIAAFSTEPAARLPEGRTRVATIHLQTLGDSEPQFELQLRTAAQPDGSRIRAGVSLEQRRTNP